MSHFYLPDSTPFYEVPYADPTRGLRAATLADAKKVGAYPSVTTVQAVAARPGLENYKIEQAIMCALTSPDVRKDMPVREVLKIVKRDSRRHAQEAAEKGSAIHDALEAGFNSLPFDPQYNETVINVMGLVNEHCGPQPWRTEQAFASGLGYGGRIDLNSSEWLIDFKTKDGPVEELKMYPDQLIQLVAYDVGLGGPQRRRLANVVASRDVPGSVMFWEWGCRDQISAALEQFLATLHLYHVKAGYWPHMAEELAA